MPYILGMPHPAAFTEIAENLSFLDDWEDRYRYIIELGQTLPPLAESEKNTATKVNGCVSQVWLVSERDGRLLRYRGESDAMIVRGLAAILIALYSGRTPEEIANARQDIVYVMGVMGHFVGDAGQPLHTTMHHHGWVTNSVTGNPHHYSNDFKFHAWIDGGFFDHTGGVDPQKLAAQIKPAETLADAGSADGIFRDAMDFIIQQNGLVEKLYQLEQAGKLAAPPADAQAGREFLEGQLVKSGQLLGNIWLTAYRTAPEDTYLSHQLELRQAAATKATEQKP